MAVHGETAFTRRVFHSSSVYSRSGFRHDAAKAGGSRPPDGGAGLGAPVGLTLAMASAILRLRSVGTYSYVQGMVQGSAAGQAEKLYVVT